MFNKHHAKEEIKICEVAGCSNEAARSIPFSRIKKVFPTLKTSEKRNIHVCKEHYKEFQKKTKKDRELERLGWG
jgi:hypothetical protein